MALVKGSKNTRIIPVEAKEPLDNDKVTVHKFSIEYEIIDRDIWKTMVDRWDELARLARKQSIDKDFVMSDSDMAEMQEQIHHIAAPYILNVTPLTDESGQAIPFTDDIKDWFINTPWLQKVISESFMAAQNGLTLVDYKRTRAKN